MEVQMLADEKILDTLERDPQKGIVLLMEKYTALIWHVSSLYVKNPEDIKECVNDIFTEFYIHRKRFNPKKAPLSTYLTAIARHRSVSLYQKRQREYSRRADISAGELAAEDDSQIEKTELRIDIERAMKLLKPDELQIIRMKYYDGMSVREIADSLELPYETVKKRHQRSVLKLGQSLMLAFVLVFILTACVYGVLRYLDVIPPIGLWTWPWQGIEMEKPEEEPDDDTGKGKVRELHLDDTTGDDRGSELQNDLAGEEAAAEYPADMPLSSFPSKAPEEDADRAPSVMESYTIVPEYGINTNPKEPVYSLDKKEFVENEEYRLTLEEAYYINHKLTVTVRVLLKEDTIENWEKTVKEFSVESVTYQDDIWKYSLKESRDLDLHSYLSIFYFENVLIRDTGQKIENMSIQFSGGDRISFSMVSVEQEKVTEYPYQVGELGGILAVPRLEDGELIIAIHPLDDKDDMRIVPGLVRDAGGDVSEKSVTVTGEDGTVLTGECVRYRPWGEETYFEWNFGKAEPGRYTLNIPWLYMQADPPEFNIEINPLENSWEDKKYPFTGGSIWIQDCVPIYEKPEGLDDLLWAGSSPAIRNWRICFRYDSVHSLCPVTGFYGLSCKMERYPVDEEENPGDWDYLVREYHMTTISNDREKGVLEAVLEVNLELANPENTNICFHNNGAVSFLWKQSFEIPFTVEENN